MAAVFMLVSSTIGLRTGFLPRWLVIAGYVCGLVFLLTVRTSRCSRSSSRPGWPRFSVVILRAASRSD